MKLVWISHKLYIDATQTIAKLREEFRTRFADFDHAHTAEKIKLLQRPFTSDIENIPTKLQLQFI